jgi:pimeloyl-ACP methyl ester carboxylesterase
VVLVSPFTSLPAVAGVHYPFVPARWLLRDRLDSLGRAPRVPVPVLILHGDQDELVPYTLGEALARALPDARLVPLVGGGHNDLWARFEGPMLDEIERHARGVR